MSAEGRERFLRVIAARVPPERIAEIHLFPPIRQGGAESGVAVIAARAEEGPAGSAPNENGTAPDAGSRMPDDSYLDTDAPLTREAPAPAVPALDASPDEGTAPADDSNRRLTIYRAHYRLTLKGPERGRWEADVTAEADAPLSAVDDVVRGVHRRAGEDAEPERLTGEQFRAALTEGPWTAAP